MRDHNGNGGYRSDEETMYLHKNGLGSDSELTEVLNRRQSAASSDHTGIPATALTVKKQANLFPMILLPVAAVCVVAALFIFGLPSDHKEPEPEETAAEETVTATQEPEEAPTFEQLLEQGCYALYQQDGTLASYMKVSADVLTAYSSYGEEAPEQSYAFDSATGRYTRRDGTAFTVEQRDQSIWLREEDQRAYRLEAVSEATISDAAMAPLNGTVDGTLISGVGWALYATVPEPMQSTLVRTATSTVSDYYIDSHLFHTEAVLYTGDDLQRLLENARGLGYNRYGTDEEMAFHYLAARLNNELSALFTSRRVPIQEDIYQTRTYNDVRWWNFNIDGGYPVNDNNIIDYNLLFRMENGVAFAVYVGAQMNGADGGHYTAAYNQFLGRQGWLYGIPGSLSLQYIGS